MRPYTRDLTVSALHAPWLPGRSESFAAIQEILEGRCDPIQEKAPTPVLCWSLFATASWRQGSHSAFFDDDVMLAPRSFDIMQAMVTAVPDKIIGLEAVSPYACSLHLTKNNWYRTKSWLVGRGYILPEEDLEDWRIWLLREWRRLATKGCDSIMNEWISETGREVWHPLPTIVDSATGILPSALGGVPPIEPDYVGELRSPCRWNTVGIQVTVDEMCNPDFWAPRDNVPLVEVGGWDK